MELLNTNDYEKIFRFYTHINANYDRFIETVLSDLDELFNIKLVVYTIFDKEANDKYFVKSIHSHHIPFSILKEYRDSFYDVDPFFSGKDFIKNTKKLKYVLCSSDLEHFTFNNSDYEHFLRKHGITNQCVIGGTNRIFTNFNNSIHALSLFTTSEDASFSDYEIALFEKVGRAFSKSTGLYKRYLMQNHTNALLLSEFSAQNVGITILSQDKEIICSNPEFFSLSGYLSSSTTPKHIMGDLLALNGDDSQMEATTPFKKVFHAKNIRIEIERKRALQLLNSTLITKIQLSPVSSSYDVNQTLALLSNTYHLTQREAEIAMLAQKGMSNAEISEQLFISLSTVKTHIRNIFHKTDVSSRPELFSLIQTKSQ
jgi:DNA-binding CsgD family transcriptional regulator